MSRTKHFCLATIDFLPKEIQHYMHINFIDNFYLSFTRNKDLNHKEFTTSAQDKAGTLLRCKKASK